MLIEIYRRLSEVEKSLIDLFIFHDENSSRKKKKILYSLLNVMPLI